MVVFDCCGFVEEYAELRLPEPRENRLMVFVMEGLMVRVVFRAEGMVDKDKVRAELELEKHEARNRRKKQRSDFIG